MNLLRRFAFFGVGLVLGFIAVGFLFGERFSSCAYLPNARVLEEVDFKTWDFSDEMLLQMENYTIDSVMLKEAMKEGDILFSESLPRKKPCGFYKMYFNIGLKEYNLYFDKCKEEVLMDSIVPLK